MSDLATAPAPDARARQVVLLALASLCVALNVGLGGLVGLIKAPVYLDAVGTVTFALLAGRLGTRGFLLAALVGAVSFLISGLLFAPAALWFVPTQVAIAAFTFYVIGPLLRRQQERLRGVRDWLVVVSLGVALGVVAGTVSAPIIAWVFGGITGSGPSLIVALLLKSGAGLFKSVLASGLASEPVDKTLQLILAQALVRATPASVRRRLEP